MDQSVLDAVKRWPDVPAVYGWLSLTARGEWKLHPMGDAQSGFPGQGISNTQILGFIDRNYASEPDGAWFFQNGPQRVYVRLDAAPLIVHVDPTSQALITHHKKTVHRVSRWLCDETGQLYAQTDCGPCRIDDRDLLTLGEVLRTPKGVSLLDVFDQLPERSPQVASPGETDILLSDPHKRYLALTEPVPFGFVASEIIPQAMRFIPNPGPGSALPAVLGRKI